MWIVGEDGAAGFRLRRRYDPVVRAFVELAVHQVGESRFGVDGSPLLFHQRLEVDLLRGEDIVIQHVCRHVARIEPSRHDSLVVLGIKLAAQFIGIDPGSASDPRARDL